ARRHAPALRREPEARRLRRVRRRPPGPGLAPLLDRGRQGRGLLAALPVRVAVGARPDGAARGDDPARALRRLEARAVHERECQARLGLGEAQRKGGQLMTSQANPTFEVATWYDTWNATGLNNLVNRTVPLNLATRYNLAFGQLSGSAAAGY